jgi:hypothetical protein
VVRDGGETLGHLLAQIERLCDSGHITRSARRRSYATGPSTGRHPRYRSCCRVADVYIGWLLLRNAEVALDAIDTGTVTQRDGAFYRGNVAAAVFFAGTVLPRLAADRGVIDSQGLAAMEFDEEAF